MTLVVHFDDDHILALVQLFGDIEVERCEPAHMMAHMMPVHIDMSIVVDSPEIQQCPASVLWPVLETTLQPYRSLVEEQPLVLRVPVARHLHGGSLVEIILYQVFGLLRLGIAEESPAGGFHAIIIIALFLNIHDIVPGAIQRLCMAGHHITNQRHFLRLYCQRCNQQHDDSQNFLHIFHV